MNKSHLPLIISLICLFSCGKGNEENVRGEIIPDDGAVVPEWARAKNQMFQLVGNIKSFRETYMSNTGYNDYTFDINGNLLEHFRVEVDADGGRWDKIVYVYDDRHRLIKRTGYSSDHLDGTNVWEYEYDGSHGVYIPSRCIDILNPFLQPGISKIKVYDLGNMDKVPLISTCNIRNKQLVFEITAGDFEKTFMMFGTGFKRLTVECEGIFPTELKAYDASNRQKLFMSLSLKWGFPDVFNFADMEKIKYVNIRNVPMPVLYENKDMTTETRYNDRGCITGKKISSGHEERYNYEYDEYGNWTKCIKENQIYQRWQREEITMRTYTYF
ncbi:MAG: hypothetical protein LBG92_08915 [Prevotellaceae bacterium]|jgi:hypothetical protein|nr:hypothetical protein [Prevotellaceae bacterium]